MKSVSNIITSQFFRFFNKKYLVYTFSSRENILYLTFDDGPDPEVTSAILKILKANAANATFFCVGENVKKYPELLHSILEEGHSVGNHTFSHLDGWKTPPGEYVENVARCNDYFKTSLFRPPYGRFSPSQYFLLRKNYKFILWSVMSFDFHRKISPDQCLSNVLDNASPGSIIVFHDNIKSKEKVLYVLPLVLDHFRKIGFRFESIPAS
jgi:peptidoglycan-N-acetylglucosamine deacetylase